MRYLNSGIFQHEVLEYVKGNNDVQKDVLKELSLMFHQCSIKIWYDRKEEPL